MVFFVFVFSIHFPLVSAAWLVGQRCGCVRTQPGTQRKKSHHGDLAAPAGLATPTTPNPRGALPTPPTHLRVPASPARLAPQRSGPGALQAPLLRAPDLSLPGASPVPKRFARCLPGDREQVRLLQPHLPPGSTPSFGGGGSPFQMCPLGSSPLG